MLLNTTERDTRCILRQINEPTAINALRLIKAKTRFETVPNRFQPERHSDGKLYAE